MYSRFLSFALSGSTKGGLFWKVNIFSTSSRERRAFNEFNINLVLNLHSFIILYLSKTVLYCTQNNRRTAHLPCQLWSNYHKIITLKNKITIQHPFTLVYIFTIVYWCLVFPWYPYFQGIRLKQSEVPHRLNVLLLLF
jgi:hypothetical protein